MSFRTAFKRDMRNVFLGKHQEFESVREFWRRGKSGTYIGENLTVLWIDDLIKNITGDYYGQIVVGDIVCITMKEDWIMRPMPKNILYSPRDTQWEIISCSEVLFTAYQMLLRKMETP
jgi:hypothetical protein